jgi:hypothetical protein
MDLLTEWMVVDSRAGTTGRRVDLVGDALVSSAARLDGGRREGCPAPYFRACPEAPPPRDVARVAARVLTTEGIDGRGYALIVTGRSRAFDLAPHRHDGIVHVRQFTRARKGESAMLDIIGAGFGRTGTLSLKSALERLGFGPCHHMTELLGNAEQTSLWAKVVHDEDPDWDAVYRGYRATVDWPGARFWRQLTERFPQAKVILTVRDPRRWYESASASIYQASLGPMPADPELARMRQIVSELVWEGEFGGRFDDPEHAMRAFEEHNETVRREVPADRLLVFEVAQGWQPLCEFLDVPVPDEPFPRSNDRQSFAEMRRRRLPGNTE